MTTRRKRSESVIQCAKCGQTDPKISYRQLFLTDSTGHRTAEATLCPACLHMFWLVFDGFIQTRPTPTPAYTRPPEGFRAAFPYHMERHAEAIQELKKQMTWHRQAIRYLREMPAELSAPDPRP